MCHMFVQHQNRTFCEYGSHRGFWLGCAEPLLSRDKIMGRRQDTELSYVGVDFSLSHHLCLKHRTFSCQRGQLLDINRTNLILILTYMVSVRSNFNHENHHPNAPASSNITIKLCFRGTVALGTTPISWGSAWKMIRWKNWKLQVARHPQTNQTNLPIPRSLCC